MAIKSNNYFRVVGGKELGIGDGVLVSGSQGEKIEKKKRYSKRGKDHEPGTLFDCHRTDKRYEETGSGQWKRCATFFFPTISNFTYGTIHSASYHPLFRLVP